jgi:8-oxo-dGTP diphosphatase
MITCASTPNTGPETVTVAVGIVEDARHRVLVTRRPEHKHQGGKWEFPGGKANSGEDIYPALARELHEELGITLHRAQPFVRVRHAYPDKQVLLDVWRVTDYSGIPHGREGQPLRWVTRAELAQLDLPDADRPILRALELPPLYLISDAGRDDCDSFLTRLEHALQAGVRLVQLRKPAMPADQYRTLAQRVVVLAHRFGARVLLNAGPSLVAECGADGVHLNSARLMQAGQRPLPLPLLVAVSCHNASEIEQANRLGADFVVLSPVRATASHPGAVPLGWEEFSRLRQLSDVPVYALGGMLPADLAIACRAGAHGLAMIRGIWEASSLDDAVGALLV